ncbi:MAG: TSUP family transporter [Cryomorphaceae bacterium]|nr:TSUP family transporter [Cryomorphaceae bacterium]
METSQLIILILIGIVAGIMSGFIGIGGGVIIVPALIYFLGLTQFQAQGTSLAIMLPPVGIMAFLNYYKADNVNLKYAAVIAITFIIGGYLGSKIALRMSPMHVRLVFGVIMLYVSGRLIWTSIQGIINNG